MLFIYPDSDFDDFYGDASDSISLFDTKIITYNNLNQPIRVNNAVITKYDKIEYIEIDDRDALLQEIRDDFNSIPENDTVDLTTININVESNTLSDESIDDVFTKTNPIGVVYKRNLTKNGVGMYKIELSIDPNAINIRSNYFDGANRINYPILLKETNDNTYLIVLDCDIINMKNSLSDTIILALTHFNNSFLIFNKPFSDIIKNGNTSNYEKYELLMKQFLHFESLSIVFDFTMPDFKDKIAYNYLKAACSAYSLSDNNRKKLLEVKNIGAKFEIENGLYRFQINYLLNQKNLGDTTLNLSVPLITGPMLNIIYLNYEAIGKYIYRIMTSFEKNPYSVISLYNLYWLIQSEKEYSILKIILFKMLMLWNNDYKQLTIS